MAIVYLVSVEVPMLMATKIGLETSAIKAVPMGTED